MRKSHSSEGHVKADVKELLKKHNWFFWMPPGSAFGTPNVDFNAIKEGAFVALETKYDKNKTTPNQRKFLRQIGLADGIPLIVNEKTIGAFATWLEAYDTVVSDAKRGIESDVRDNPELKRATAILTAELNEDERVREAIND